MRTRPAQRRRRTAEPAGVPPQVTQSGPAVPLRAPEEAARLGALPRTEHRSAAISALGATIGNRAVGRLLGADNPAPPGRIQRGFFDSLDEAWDSVTGAASDLWQALSGDEAASDAAGGSTPKPAGGGGGFEAGDFASVTDPKAFMRRAATRIIPRS